MGWKFPEIPRPHPVVHLHYLEHFGASENNTYYEIEMLRKFQPPSTRGASIKLDGFAMCNPIC